MKSKLTFIYKSKPIDAAHTCRYSSRKKNESYTALMKRNMNIKKHS